MSNRLASISLLLIVCTAAFVQTSSGFTPVTTIRSRTRTEVSSSRKPTFLHSSGTIKSVVAQVPSLRLSASPSTPSSPKSDDKSSIRAKLRKITGFSLTALRATMRAATGVSLTAIYASTVAVTGAWIRQIMKGILSIFPAWFRYFLQPFLILYYAPLFILRNLTGPTRKHAIQTHEHFIEGWKSAVEKAEETSSYWPLHVNEDGYIEKDTSDVDFTDAVAESVEVALEEEEREKH